MPTGHLEKRSENAWSIIVDLGRDPATGRGQRIRRSVKGANRRQAEAEMRRLLAELESGTYIEPSKETLGDYLRDRLENAAAPRLRPNTLANYRTMIEAHIIPAVGRIPLAALQPLHLQQFYRQARESGRVGEPGGLSARSVVLIHTVIHASLKQAFKWRMISQNPADAVDVPRPRRATMQALAPKKRSS